MAEDSETQLANDADTLGSRNNFNEDKADEAEDSADQVFNNYWTAGEGAEAAEAAYKAGRERPTWTRLKSARLRNGPGRRVRQRCRTNQAPNDSRKRRRTQRGRGVSAKRQRSVHRRRSR